MLSMAVAAKNDTLIDLSFNPLGCMLPHHSSNTTIFGFSIVTGKHRDWETTSVIVTGKQYRDWETLDLS